MRSYTLHGQTIEVEFRPFGAFLWLCAGFVVRVDGRSFYPKPTGASFMTETEFDFDADGRRVSGVVRSLAPMWFLPRMRYAIFISEHEVERDVQTLHRWYLSYLAWGVCFVTMLLALLGVVTLGAAIMRYFHVA
jgi:hypothetical protein